MIFLNQFITDHPGPFLIMIQYSFLFFNQKTFSAMLLVFSNAKLHVVSINRINIH